MLQVYLVLGRARVMMSFAGPGQANRVFTGFESRA